MTLKLYSSILSFAIYLLFMIYDNKKGSGSNKWYDVNRSYIHNYYILALRGNNSKLQGYLDMSYTIVVRFGLLVVILATCLSEVATECEHYSIFSRTWL